MTLQEYCERKNISKIIELIEQGENYTILDENGTTPLQHLQFEYNEYVPLKEVNQNEYSIIFLNSHENVNLLLF